MLSRLKWMVTAFFVMELAKFIFDRLTSLGYWLVFQFYQPKIFLQALIIRNPHNPRITSAEPSTLPSEHIFASLKKIKEIRQQLCRKKISQDEVRCHGEDTSKNSQKMRFLECLRLERFLPFPKNVFFLCVAKDREKLLNDIFGTLEQHWQRSL